MLASGWETVTAPRIEVEEVCAVGDRVVVRWRASGNGRVSGMRVEWHESHVYWLSDGRIAEVREFRTWDEALAAAEPG